ncbi:MAG: hypothetical protein HN337_06225 [Deltaproteobacteria bacterium]|nr:hypothetical protein [Deltaproteobacteria bacterium]
MILISSSVLAGGPFAVDTVNDSGVALRWGSNTLEWYLDPGAMASGYTNATGKEWVEDALDKWSNITIKNASLAAVNTCQFNASYQGELDEDITVDNVSPYISTSSGHSAVIFDEDGEITASLMGESNKSTVVGLSAPLLSDSTGLYITKGFALFNGYVLSSGILASTESVEDALFQATILHELGHLINLDHSQVNDSVAQQCANAGTVYSRNGSCAEGGQYIPTMYPELLTTLQGNLARDDKVTLSWIYPNNTFDNDFCVITGQIFDDNGDPLKGVNVVARRVGGSEGMSYVDARSFVSGAMHTGCTGTDSSYYLYGIVPGQAYQVTYEALNTQYTGASGFEPCDDPPSGFESGTIAGTDGETTVSCEASGETVEMASQTVSTSGGGGGGGGGDDPTDSSGGGCGNIGGGSNEDLHVVLTLLLAACFIITIFRKRSYR